jgi:hypothetical protein
MKAHTLVTISTLVSASLAGAQKPRDISAYLTADRAAEIALARTAAPSSITSKATILVLTPKGYVQAVNGTNGFTCLVTRSFTGDPDDPQFWNPHTSGPLCFNPPASRTLLPGTITKSNWAISGVTTADLKARIKKAYADKRFMMPAPGSMAYMLSPKQHLNDGANPAWMPHLMFFYDRSVNAGAFGAGDEPAPIIATDPNATVETFLIPTRAWSDGTPAMRAKPGK